MSGKKAILIDSENRCLREVSIDLSHDTLKQMQMHVNGPIETALVFENGDYLFVDENGMLKPQEHFFFVKGGHQPFAGNGLLVGPENDAGDLLDVQTKITALEITFMARYQVVQCLQEEGEYHA